MIKKAVIKSLPVMAGYIVLGTGFGILLRVNGYGLFYALLMSVFIYAGSMQYVGISLITGDVSIITTALTTLMVNARHLFYGISMIDEYKNAGVYKPYLMFGLTDETYSLLCNGENSKDPDKYKFYTLITLFNQCYWIIGAVIGSILGSVLKFSSAGIDFSMTALFVTVFVEQWLTTKNHIPAIAGIIISILCLLVFGPERFLIPAMIFITAALFLLKPILDKIETSTVIEEENHG